MSQAEIREGCASVERWLKSVFPGARLEHDEDTRRGEFVFQIEEGDHWYELSFSEEALEDLRSDLEAILEKQDAAAMLRENPNSRLPFITETQRLFPCEQLKLQVDGKIYIVTREKQLVRILDENGDPLERMPPRTLTPDSIHKGDLSRWPEQIRKWRGETQ